MDMRRANISKWEKEVEKNKAAFDGKVFYLAQMMLRGYCIIPIT